jgi:hypothetical protein
VKSTKTKASKVKKHDWFNIDNAAQDYVAAACALRDAKKMLQAGFEKAVAHCRPILSKPEDALDMDEAFELVVGKEASDLLELFDRSPSEYPEGRTAARALVASRKTCKKRYGSGTCALCKGPALACARRHAHGRSCA